MLRRLHVKDFALIEDVEIEFGAGFNVITGETGAGKSVLLGSLGLILGERGDTDMVRDGTTRCTVEACFEFPKGHPAVSRLEKTGVEVEDGELILRRELGANGRSRCFVNGLSATVATLRTTGNLLVDMHGQHEHQSLLNVESHLGFLDGFGGLLPLAEQVRVSYEKLSRLRRELRELRGRRRTMEERRDLELYQLEEITTVAPEPSEDDRLERERTVLENTEMLSQVATELCESLYDAEDSVVDRLSVCLRDLEPAAKVDQDLRKKVEDLDALRYATEDLAAFFREYVAQIESDPQRLEEIRDRLGLLERLKRKYGGSIESILTLQHELEGRVDLSGRLEGEIARIEGLIKEALKGFSDLCVRLAAARRKTAGRLGRQVERELKGLGMGRTEFEVHTATREDPEGEVEIEGTRYRGGPNGLEAVEFFLAANPGEPKRPLAKIASGGEISRIMLALKSALAEVDAIPALIFDEIDIGISGRIAEAVGRKLQSLSRSHQIISITHLPQIASLGERHFTVVKEVRRGRSITRAQLLNESERAEEVARLIAGEEISDTAVRHAEEMLRQRSEA